MKILVIPDTQCRPGVRTDHMTWIGRCAIDLKPDFIVECGTALGGSTLYMANICDLLGHGKVISIDIIRREKICVIRIIYFNLF